MSFHVGETLGDYEIKAIIGAGSMGQVYQAEHRLTERREALKVLSAEFADHKQIQRFQREIALQAGLNHPNIAAVHNAMQIDGRMVLVMEFVEGHTLENLFKTGSFSLELGLDYIRQTLSALSHAHAHGVIHRDVNPANLIIMPDGAVKLTDFGVAKSCGDLELTGCGEVIGSLHYMPPEQVRGKSEPDPRSDIYSVGAILYQMVTRRKLFESENALELLLTQPDAEPKRPTEIDPNLSPEWDTLIMRALAKDPGQRYSSADEFLEALHRFLEPGPVAESMPRAPKLSLLLGKLRAQRSWPQLLSTLSKRIPRCALSRPQAMIAGSAALALFAVVGTGIGHFGNPPPPPAVSIHIAPPEQAALAAAVLAPHRAAINRHAKRRRPKRESQPVVAKQSTELKPAPPGQVQPAAEPTEQSPVQPSPQKKRL